MIPTNWSKRLTDWFSRHQRPMPWRDNPEPYYVWVSEIMLQQTQVDTVIPYFNRFINRFSTLKDLAEASEHDVLKLWEGLGYYSRARNLQKAAKLVQSTYNGQIPSTYDSLQLLPGIGPYVAAAIASIAFNEPVPVVDGNVFRVFTRFWGISEDIRLPKTRTLLFDKLTPIIQTAIPSQFNQAMMECGALICKPSSPKCPQCPLNAECIAYSTNTIAQYPVKSPSKKVPHYTIGVGVIKKDGKILIAKRKSDQMLGGLWEFPGGKQQDGEPLEATIKREIKEETTLDVDVQTKITSVNHAYSHFKITLHAFWCEWIRGTAVPNTSDEIRWIQLSELSDYPFPKANKTVCEKIMKA